MSGASVFSRNGTITTASTSPTVPMIVATPSARHASPPATPRADGGHERCENFGDMSVRAAPRRARDARCSAPGVVASPAFARESTRASRDASWSRRFVLAGVRPPARIVCEHAGLSARTTIDAALRSRVRVTALDFFGAPFSRECVDRNRAGSITAAIDRVKFVLAATTSSGGIKAGTVRSNTIPRGRTAGTFPSRARQVVRHRRESDPGGAGISAAPSRPGFSREGWRSSEEPGSMDQGGPK